MKARFVGLALVGAALAFPAAAQAGVVVKSTGPSSGDYPVGREIADSATITLRSGDKITVLTEGGTRVMQGPGTFRVGEGATRTRGRFSNLTRRGAGQVRTGAVRGTPSNVRPSLWMIDVTAAGNMCLFDFDRVRVWRPETDVPQTFSVVSMETQDSLDIAFVGTEATRSVDPQGLAVKDSGTYRITGPVSQETGEASSVVVNLVGLPDESLENQEKLAAALYAAGCTAQLSVLADELEDAAGGG